MRVLQVRVAMSINWAVIMPGMLPTAARLMRTYDVTHLDLPVAGAGALSVMCRALLERGIVTHHCDRTLDGNLVQRFAAETSSSTFLFALMLSHGIGKPLSQPGWIPRASSSRRTESMTRTNRWTG